MTTKSKMLVLYLVLQVIFAVYVLTAKEAPLILWFICMGLVLVALATALIDLIGKKL